MSRYFGTKIVILILLLAGAIAISYSNSINSPFVFDDYPNIIDNKFIKISTLHTDEILTAASNGNSRHRWIPNITFAIQYYFHGLKTAPYHIFNILVHVLCAATLLLLIQVTLNYSGNIYEKERKLEIAFWTAALWSLHPLQTNSVTYIVQRMTSLSALFYLSSVLLYAQGRLPGQSNPRKYLWFGSAIFSGFCAIISKENAAMLPLMIIAYEIFIISPDWLANNRRQALFSTGVAVIVLFFLGWLWIGGNIFDHVLNSYQGRYFSPIERLMTEPRVIFLYISLLFFPTLTHLNINHDIVLSTSLLSPPSTIMAIIGLVLLAYSIYYLYRKNRLISFALLWFLANLAIESSIIPLELCFEHRLYLPSSFFIFALVLILYQSARRHIPLLRISITIIAIVLGVLTWNRNVTWQSRVALWSDSLAKSPNLIRTYVNLGIALRSDKKLALAQKYLEQALELDAERKIDRSQLAWKKEMAPVHSSLAAVYRIQKKFRQARHHAEIAIQLDPNSVETQLTMGILLVQEGKYDLANTLFTKLAAQGLDTVDLYNNWGISTYHSGETDRAILFFQHALQLDPDHAESHYNLGLAYGKKGLREEARREMALGMQL